MIISEPFIEGIVLSIGDDSYTARLYFGDNIYEAEIEIGEDTVEVGDVLRIVNGDIQWVGLVTITEEQFKNAKIKGSEMYEMFKENE